ncbi:Uncharacterized protein dnm_038910 [Desulfonema magnum]|uniref:Uncharacterized protein n=1 Tax=Desulfonema magnum TaxID=45655 RepID=A0A975GPF4_9BACT|nr:Uncharacterized protein dnm_038910 [Desulfonema magnum]
MKFSLSVPDMPSLRDSGGGMRLLCYKYAALTGLSRPPLNPL